MSPAAPDPDAGLQNERTELAWQRSALSVLVVGAALARASGTLPGTTAVVVALVALVVAPLLVPWTARRYAARHDLILATGVAGPDRRVLVATALTTALGLAGLALILLG